MNKQGCLKRKKRLKTMRKLLIAFQFLTILPVKIREHISEYDIAGSSMFFPVVGAFQGVVVVLLVVVLRDVFCGGVACHATVEIISVLVIMILIITNKGLHLDGLPAPSKMISS